MKSYLKYLCAALMIAVNVEAALPPVYESINEFKALIDSPELASTLGSAEGIIDIQRAENGFLVISYRKMVVVDIVRDAQAMPGPAKFHLVFHPSTARE